jgi:phenylpropionate dioxygenase-like ring-hydroxylating dioxygenase large terminal subunit
MNGDGFIRNCWYVCARSEDVAARLTSRRVLGEAVVLFRRNDGTVAALEDACPHRKLPLSKGTLQNDRVVCGYHGLTFDGTGSCVAAPTQENSVPRRARVASYPIQERYGFVWIWMGDPVLARTTSLIDIPEYDNPFWGRTASGALEISCHYLWITDNLLDPSHVAWVHLTSFAGAGTDNVPIETTEEEDRIIVWRWIRDRPAPPYYAPFLAFQGNCDRKQHYECRLPAIAINKSVYTPVGTGGSDEKLPSEAFVNFSYNFMTPVDEDHALYFWFQHRNQRPDDAEMSAAMFAGATMAFNEDKEVLEEVHRGMKTAKSPYINLGLDAAAMRFRKKVERRIVAEAETVECTKAVAAS